jgi:hypothetical protein
MPDQGGTVTDPTPYAGEERRDSDRVLADLERRIDAKLDEHEAATQARAAALELRIDGKLDAIRADVTAQIGRVVERLDQLTGQVGTIERDKIIADARAEGRQEALRDIAEGTSPSRPAPLLGEPRGWDRLAAWLTQWSPWQAILLAALVVGGPTVAGPAMERLLSVMLPTAQVELAPDPSSVEESERPGGPGAGGTASAPSGQP